MPLDNKKSISKIININFSEKMQIEYLYFFYVKINLNILFQNKKKKGEKMRRFKIFDTGLTEDGFKYEVWKTYYMTEEAHQNHISKKEYL